VYWGCGVLKILVVGFGGVKGVGFVWCGMSGNRNGVGGLLVGFLGALFGLRFPRMIIGLVVLFGLFVVGRVVWSACSGWWEEQVFVARWESVLVSWYYRTRVRVLVGLGVVKRRRSEY